MAVGFDAKITGGNGAGGFNQEASAAVTISSTGITVGGSATGLIAGLCFGRTGGVVPTGVSMTWNGTPMTAGPSINDGTGAGAGSWAAAFIFVIPSPASGANTLAGAWTGANDVYMWAVSLTGTDTSTVINAAHSVTATAATNITVTSDTSGATVACFACDGGDPTVNFTELFSTAPLNPGGGANYTLGGTSNNHTFTGAGGTHQALVGVHVIASGGGGGPARRRIRLVT